MFLPSVIVIQIPALTQYLQYLKDKDTTQAAIDLATNQLKVLTQRFEQSEAKLLGAIPK